MKKNIIIATTLGMLVIVTFIVSLTFITSKEEKKLVPLSFNDEFDHSLLKNTGNSYLLNDDRVKILFYLSNRCSACIDWLPDIQRIHRIYSANNMALTGIIWEGEGLESNFLNDIPQFYVDDSMSFFSQTPMMFFLDNENVVKYQGHISISILAQKLAQMLPNDAILGNAVSYLNTEIASKNTDYYEQNNSVVMFSSSGCTACETQLPGFLQKCENELLNSLIISDDMQDDDTIMDTGLYSSIFGVTQTPAYILISRYEILGDIHDKYEDIIKN